MVALVGGLIALIGFGFFVLRKLPKRIKTVHYTKKWRDIQKLCANKETWPNAIIEADKLLDEVLKKRRKSGKSMGERMVEAQKDFTVNDAVWKAHKLANHLLQTESAKLKEDDVKGSLVAYRQALRDLGAI
jgi:hypothetical protein